MIPRFLSFLLAALMPVALGAAEQPNVVLIYADDIGYGDVSCYGATSVSTPHIDRLAEEGLRFRDGHCASATCTPSRYAMLTGKYAWRQTGTGIAKGDQRMIIEPGRHTLATVFQKAGYATGVVGKWHLGLGDGDMDWNGPIGPGPQAIGFDYCFLMPATGDRVPCVYVENDKVLNLDPADPITVSFGKPLDIPTGKANPEMLKMHPSHGHDQTIVNGVSRIGYMSGGKSALWRDEDMADEFVKKALAFIDQNKAEPFFLYFSTHDIHVPRMPHERFVGATGMGPRGDTIVEFDWCVGELMKALDDHGIAENTLVILSSDNGPVIDDGYHDDSVEKLGEHKAAGPFRGGKYSLFEGGTRVPFIVRWKGRVTPGTSDALMCQVDFPASMAALIGQEFDVPTAPDSENHLAALLGESQEGRTLLVEHGKRVALRHGGWKLIPGGSGPAHNDRTNTELGNDPGHQLYNLSNDIGERTNVANQYPDKVTELMGVLKSELERADAAPGLISGSGKAKKGKK
jgi:arylsulfatase A-like enzyme